jgi:hypothetical protein
MVLLFAVAVAETQQASQWNNGGRSVVFRGVSAPFAGAGVRDRRSLFRVVQFAGIFD